MRTVLLFLLGLWTGISWSAAADWDTGPRPGWVDFQAHATPPTPAADQLEGGSFDLHIETQIHLETQEVYRRNAFLIVNESGVQDSSSLQIPFDPTYMHLTLHEIKLTRDGRVIDKLDPSKVRMLNREENLESNLLDGNLTFYYPLEDVRVGDAIEYSYTLKGFQPAFGGKFFTNCVLQWSSPVGHQLFRVVGGSSRPLNVRTLAGAPPPRITGLAGDLKEWRWEASDVPALLPEENRPRWHNAYPAARLSEMNSWNEVSQWAEGLYELGAALGPAEKEAVDEIMAKNSSETSRIEAALKFVQENIRYLGFEIGHGSYRPTGGETVLNRRYGDCKDKAQLLIRLLRGMGISAHPALVNTAWAAGVADFPPSPLAFNHVICKVVDGNGQAYWLDPTLPTQAGPLAARHAGNFGFGLVVAPETRDLEAIPESTGADWAEITETFEIGADKDPVEFTVRSVFSGQRADAERSTFQESSLDRIGRNFRDYYAKTYPEIEQVEAVRISDFPEESRFIVEEKYRIPNFWKKNKNDRNQATFYPTLVYNEFSSPKSVNRKTPFAISHPRKTIQNLELRFTEPWDFTPKDDRVENDHFRFSHTGVRDQNTIRLRYEYHSKSDSVPPERVAAYRKAVETITDEMGWTFTAKGPAGSPWRMNWFPLLPATAALAVAMGLIFPLVFYRKIPPPLPRRRDARYIGLGGWLILVQIWLWASPISQLAVFYNLRWLFDGNAWEAYTVPGGLHYSEIAALIFSFELFGNVLIFPLQITAIVLFYQKRWIVPRLLIGLHVFVILFHLADQALAAGLPGAESSPQDIVSALVRGAIWIPYFLRSRRVRGTFVRP